MSSNSRITTRALYHLKNTRQRSKTAMLVAWEDLFTLRDWFIQKEEDDVVAAFTANIDKENAGMTAYADIERYRANVRQGIELHYLGLVDVFLRQLIRLC